MSISISSGDGKTHAPAQPASPLPPQAAACSHCRCPSLCRCLPSSLAHPTWLMCSKSSEASGAGGLEAGPAVSVCTGSSASSPCSHGSQAGGCGAGCTHSNIAGMGLPSLACDSSAPKVRIQPLHPPSAPTTPAKPVVLPHPTRRPTHLLRVVWEVPVMQHAAPLLHLPVKRALAADLQHACEARQGGGRVGGGSMRAQRQPSASRAAPASKEGSAAAGLVAPIQSPRTCLVDVRGDRVDLAVAPIPATRTGQRHTFLVTASKGVGRRAGGSRRSCCCSCCGVFLGRVRHVCTPQRGARQAPHWR